MIFELSPLGWSSFFQDQWQSWSLPELTPARIAADHRGSYEVWSVPGNGWARVAGRLRHQLREREFPGVGDWVALDTAPGPDQTAVIQRIFDRRTVFTRGAAGRETRDQVVAANVDLVFVVCGLDADFNLRRIERYVARVWASGALPVVVLSKADLVEDHEARAGEVRARTPGVEVLATSALRGDGLMELRARIAPGSTAALVGSSGAGKSTLVNALSGEETMTTAAVRSRDGRGCHTTTHRQLMLLPGGGMLLDTPGMRELRLSGEAGLAGAFDDVMALAELCRFTDCSHGDEPGCAVRGAIETGALDDDRLSHFIRLQREGRSYERRHDVSLRRADDRARGRFLAKAKREVRRKGH